MIFPPFLFREVRKYDGVIACEGSMFKSKFANALTDHDHRRAGNCGRRK